VQGAESDELAAASKLEDGVNFYQTVVPEVAKLFHIDSSVKRPALILLKKEEEKLNHFGLFLVLLPPFPLKKSDISVFFCEKLISFTVSADGKFVKSEIAEFVSSNKLPLVTIFTRESAPAIFESEIKKQVIACIIIIIIICISNVATIHP